MKKLVMGILSILVMVVILPVYGHDTWITAEKEEYTVGEFVQVTAQIDPVLITSNNNYVNMRIYQDGTTLVVNHIKQTTTCGNFECVEFTFYASGYQWPDEEDTFVIELRDNAPQTLIVETSFEQILPPKTGAFEILNNNVVSVGDDEIISLFAPGADGIVYLEIMPPSGWQNRDQSYHVLNSNYDGFFVYLFDTTGLGGQLGDWTVAASYGNLTKTSIFEITS